MRLEHAVEGRGRRVGDVRVHRVHVEKGRQPAPRAQERERRVHHHVGAHQLAARVVVAVQAGEEVEAAVEGRLLAVDHRVGDRRAGREAARVEAAGDRHLRGIERVAQLHRAVLAGQVRGEDRRDRRLGPRRVRDRRLEHDRVLRESVELRRGVALVAVHAGVVGAQRVHQVQDRERRPLRRRDGRRAPEGLAGLAGLLVPARLEHELAPLAGVAAEVDVDGHEAAVLVVRDRVDEQREGDLLALVPAHLHHELDAGTLVVARVDRHERLEAAVLGDVDLEAQPAGRSRGEAAHEDVVEAQARSTPLEHGLALERGGPRLDERGPGLEQVGGRRGAAAAEHERGRRGQEKRLAHHGEEGTLACRPRRGKTREGRNERSCYGRRDARIVESAARLADAARARASRAVGGVRARDLAPGRRDDVAHLGHRGAAVARGGLLAAAAALRLPPAGLPLFPRRAVRAHGQPHGPEVPAVPGRCAAHAGARAHRPKHLR